MKSLPNGSNGLMFLSGSRFGTVVIEGLLALLKLFHQYPNCLKPPAVQPRAALHQRRADESEPPHLRGQWLQQSGAA